MDQITVRFVALALLCCTVIVPVTAENVSLGTLPDTQQIGASIGPGNPLYGFKIALENFDESFTPNQTEKLKKELNRTKLRLAELNTSLAANQSDEINQTLDLYWQKVNQSDETLERIVNTDGQTPNATGQSRENGTGLEQALANLNQHQETFRFLMQAYPNNTGIAQAYNNSLERQLRFEEKIQVRAQSGDNIGHKGLNATDKDTFVPPGQQDRAGQNPIQNGTGSISTPPDILRYQGASGNVTPINGVNQSAQSNNGSGQGHPDNQGGENSSQGQPADNTANNKDRSSGEVTQQPTKTSGSEAGQNNGNNKDKEDTPSHGR